MRKILFFALLIFTSQLFAVDLSNPGFEDGDAWWNSQVNENATASFDYVSPEARSGTNACHAAVTSVTANNWEVQLNVPSNWIADSGNVYTLEFYVKADSNAVIHVAAQDGPPSFGYRTGTNVALQANADWELVQFEYTADTSGEGVVRFNIFVGETPANYYFDDFTLTETVLVPFSDFQAPPVEGAYYTDEYRNLFAEANKDSAAIRARVDAAFQQLFYGDDSNERVYYPIGDDLAYILDVNSGDIRSEGMSYGMMICVQLDKKNEFDRLWNYAKTYMQHQDGPRTGYFSWQVDPETNEMLDENSASDGEEYFATALFFAAHRWGNGEGIYNYEAEANQILYDMLHLEERNGGVVDGLTNMFNPVEKKVVFVPQYSNADFTDPSYHLPAFYKLWAEWAEQDNDFWTEVADTSRAFLQRATHPNTGLTTDYMTFGGQPYTASFYSSSDNFSSDSYRVAMNIAMDCSWWGYEDWHSEQLDSLLMFLSGFGTTYNSQYEQDGTPMENTWVSSGFYAMNGVAPLGATVQESWSFINTLWGMSIPAGQYRYYDGLLYMFGLLNAAGEYKIWKPEGSPFDTTGTTGYINIIKENVSVRYNSGSNSVVIDNSLNVPVIIADIHDITGNIVARIDEEIIPNSSNSVSVPLKEGVYFITLTSEQGSFAYKLIK